MKGTVAPSSSSATAAATCCGRAPSSRAIASTMRSWVFGEALEPLVCVEEGEFTWCKVPDRLEGHDSRRSAGGDPCAIRLTVRLAFVRQGTDGSSPGD